MCPHFSSQKISCMQFDPRQRLLTLRNLNGRLLESDCCWKVSVYRRIAIRGCLNPRIAQSRSLHVEGIDNIMGGVIDFTSLFFLNKNIVFLAQAEVIILFSADFRQNILNYSFLMENILVERSTLNQYA